ncbi:MAG: chaperone NapD [Alphaproteobacteria bacterium]|nr:chaperone NapD [Alphaproteobacteria bacterium]
MRVKKFIDEEEGGTAGAEGNLCGVLVQVRPDRMEPVQRDLCALPGVEIHHAEPDGRLVVTVEDTDQASAGETLHVMQGLAGVAAISLVYHHHAGVTGEA